MRSWSRTYRDLHGPAVAIPVEVAAGWVNRGLAGSGTVSAIPGYTGAAVRMGPDGGERLVCATDWMCSESVTSMHTGDMLIALFVRI